MGETARQVTAGRVSSGYFALFGASPVLGRDFQRDDEHVMEAARLVILSHRTWTASFGRDPEVIGREILLDDEQYRVIGVSAEGFSGPREEMEVWTPLRSDPEGMTHAFHLLRVYGRTSHRASSGGSESNSLPANGGFGGRINVELGRIGATLAERFPTSHGQTVLRGARLKETLVQPVRAHLQLLFAGVMALMALACVTAGNMTAAAVRRRRKELAIRGALGASRMQILRLPLFEAFAWWRLPV